MDWWSNKRKLSQQKLSSDPLIICNSYLHASADGDAYEFLL